MLIMDKKGTPKKDEPKNHVPGATYVKDDAEAKKGSRRRKKTAIKDESSESGPSVHLALKPVRAPQD